MRGITGTLVVLFVAGYVASRIELPRAWSDASPNVIQKDDGWRRTATGWEKAGQWGPAAASPTRPIVAQIHPLSIAVLQVLISLFVLLLYDNTQLGRPTVVRRRPVGSTAASGRC